MRIEALLLDLDRTLVDAQSYTDYEAACHSLDDEFGTVELIDVPESGWRTATHRAMATLSSLAPHPDRWTRADAIISSFESDAVRDQAVAMPHLDRFMHDTTEIPRAVVTLMGQEPAEAACRRFGIEVQAIVGRARNLLPKPEPDQLVLALEQLGIEAQASLMVGDSPWDEGAATAAGSGFVGLTNGRKSVFDKGVLVVDNLMDVSAILSR